MVIPEIKHKDRKAHRKANDKKSEAVLELERLADETIRRRHQEGIFSSLAISPASGNGSIVLIHENR